MPREDTYKNLVKRSREELIEMGKKGGRANAERIRREKTLNEIAKAVLLSKVSEKQAREKLGEYSQFLDSYTLGEILTIKQAMEADAGNTKAYEVLRDTAGFKPTERQEITAEIMTESDRSLLELVAKRQGLTEKQPKTPQ